MGRILDFDSQRKKKIEKKRRAFERIVFENFFGCHAVIDHDNSVYSVALIDISKEGLFFQVPLYQGDCKEIKKNEEIKMRIYFTEDSYISIVATIRHSRETTEHHDGRTYMSYGCQFDTSLPSFEAMDKFIDFLYSFAQYSSTYKKNLRCLGPKV